MASAKEVNVQVKIHTRTVFMKLDTSQTVLDFLKTNAEKFGISSPERFVINLPSVLDKEGHSRWLSHSTSFNSVYLREGDCLLVKNQPHLINVAVSDGSNDWVKNFDPSQKNKIQTFQCDFDDLPLDLLPELKQESFLQKETQYVFKCVLFLVNGTKTSFFLNSSVSLHEQNVPHEGFLVLWPFSSLTKITVEQLHNPDMSGFLIKSSIKNGKTTPVKRRFTAVRDHFLYYFKSQQGAPSGVVPLEYYAVYISDDDSMLIKLVPMLFEGRHDHVSISPLCKNTYLLKMENQKQMDEWFPVIASHCANYAGKSVFGLSLSTLMARKASMFSEIPEIAYKTFDYLGHHMNAEGLFRLSGSSSDVALYKSMWTTGIAVDYDKLKPDPHTVASLFKMWLREMPVPLFPPEVYDRYVSLDEKSKPEKLESLPKLLQDLPRENRNLVMELIKFAYRVSQHSEKNKMTPNNLAIVFGPNLLKKSGGAPSLREAADSTAVVSITEFMIAHNEEIQSSLFPKKPLTGRISGTMGVPFSEAKIGGERIAAVPGPPNFAGSGGHFAGSGIGAPGGPKPLPKPGQVPPPGKKLVLPPPPKRPAGGPAGVGPSPPPPYQSNQASANPPPPMFKPLPNRASTGSAPAISPLSSSVPPPRKPTPVTPSSPLPGRYPMPIPPSSPVTSEVGGSGQEPTLREVLRMLEEEIKKRELLEQRVVELEKALRNS